MTHVWSVCSQDDAASRMHSSNRLFVLSSRHQQGRPQYIPTFCECTGLKMTIIHMASQYRIERFCKDDERDLIASPAQSRFVETHGERGRARELLCQCFIGGCQRGVLLPQALQGLYLQKQRPFIECRQELVLQHAFSSRKGKRLSPEVHRERKLSFIA